MLPSKDYLNLSNGRRIRPVLRAFLVQYKWEVVHFQFIISILKIKRRISNSNARLDASTWPKPSTDHCHFEGVTVTLVSILQMKGFCQMESLILKFPPRSNCSFWKGKSCNLSKRVIANQGYTRTKVSSHQFAHLKKESYQAKRPKR